MAIIDQVLELGWNDERLARLLKLHVVMIFRLGPGVSMTESLADIRRLVQVERYLLENLGRPEMLTFVQLAGREPTGPAGYFKTDAVKLLRERPPHELLKIWADWRTTR